VTRGENKLSKLDKRILNILLGSNDSYPTSKSIVIKLDVPATTIQRRRKRLEKEELRPCHEMDLEKYKLHRVEFLIATSGGQTLSVAKRLLKLKEVTYAAISIGQPTIDLRIEAILKDNEDILRVLEMIKATAGVRDAVWTEIVQVVQRKAAVPEHIINEL
jgi:DNA-binding Lrp family transcriptional regulator